VAGELQGSRRKANAVSGRDVLTLDMDNVTAGGTQDVLKRVEALGCSYCVYSTRKHEEAKPRLRVLLPLSRTATADEYEPLARKLAAIIGIEMCDPSTFEASRLMYWPSCCADSSYIYVFGDKPLLDADGVLALYSDWRNVSEWPEVPGITQQRVKLQSKQSDPATKTGVVGAFCRTYDIYRALEIFLPDKYIPCDIPDRYTFTGGSTTGGAVIYDGGAFLFSHHATDPAGGKLCNSFDLVRYHLFADRDDEAKPDTPTNKLPSYTAMCEFAVADTNVAAVLNTERYEKATEIFSTPPDEADTNWLLKIINSPTTGQPAKDPDNVSLMLEHDPMLKGRFKKDLFSDRIFGLAPLPWGRREHEDEEFIWEDADFDGLRIYTNKVLRFHSKDIIEMSFNNYVAKHSYNPVTEYLTSLEWDGVHRLDTLFIDYLGAADNEYVRAVTRKAFTAAVARAMTPGVKFDNMTILTGAQGVGKSTLLKKMGRDWYSDSIKTFEGKEASELVQGVWVVEFGELEAFNKSDINRIKQFLSQQEDIFRAAYGRYVAWHKRRCVFFGTSNNGEYLRDRTGNRRFWPLDVYITKPRKSVFDDLDCEVNHLWAEAFMRWQLGEPLYLTGDIEKKAIEEQESHREQSAKEGIISEFLNKKIPEDWQKWPLDRRKTFWSGGMSTEEIKLETRKKVCVTEVWCEAFNGDLKYIKQTDTKEIGDIIHKTDGWKRANSPLNFGYCGKIRGFISE
jgi:predicted P-loop ATPase